MVALVALQLKVADWPLEIEVGDALNVAVGGTGPWAAIGHSGSLIPARVAERAARRRSGDDRAVAVVDLEIVRGDAL